jgi:putative sterol carrier protein
MKQSKVAMLQWYREALKRCVDAFARLDDKEWGKKASEHWTAKEHLAHLASNYEDEILVITRQGIAGQPASVPGFATQDDQLEFFRSGVAKLKDLPVPELLQRYQAAAEQHIAMLEELDEGMLDKPASSPAWSREGTIRDLFSAGYLFLANQYQEIRRVNKKKLPHWVDAGPPEFVNFHLDRLYNYMALIVRGDRAEDAQVTYQFNIEGPGGGLWRIKIADSRGSCEDGDGEYDAEIKTKPEHWMDLASGDLNPPMAIMTRKVKLGGNAGLAMKLGSYFGSTGN